MKKADIIRKTKQILRLTDIICKKNKGRDRSNVFNTLRSLQQTPIERLELSIRRANLSLYAKRVINRVNNQ